MSPLRWWSSYFDTLFSTWPPPLPVLNLCDFWLLSFFKDRVWTMSDVQRHMDSADLKAEISYLWNIPSCYVGHTITCFEYVHDLNGMRSALNINCKKKSFWLDYFGFLASSFHLVVEVWNNFIYFSHDPYNIYSAFPQYQSTKVDST